MKISLIGAGCGIETLTMAAMDTIRASNLVLGNHRLLDLCQTLIPEHKRRETALTASEIINTIAAGDAQQICVLLSGDSGYYSAAGLLYSELRNRYEVEIIPGISSMQLFAARLRRPWKHWILRSMHGKSVDILSSFSGDSPVFFLTSGSKDVNDICQELTDAGLGGITVTVGEALGSDQEQIVSDTAASLRKQSFHPLNVVLVEAPSFSRREAAGLPDHLFQRREGVPMTKQVVRASAMGLLRVGEDDVCWDIGAGTGSVSVEMALQSKAVWAVERSAQAMETACRNRESFGVWNLRLISGEAPEVLAHLPDPDKVFIGGSGGHLPEILQEIQSRIQRKKENHLPARPVTVCVSAIALETLEQARKEMEALGVQTEITQIAVSQSKRAGDLHMMLSQNPVYLVLGTMV